MNEPLDIQQDEDHDTVRINGTLYSRELFRQFGVCGMKVGSVYRITKRDANGVCSLETYAPGTVVTA